MSSAEEICKKILHMICDVNDYQLIQSKLTGLHPLHTETVWEEVGDLMGVWLDEQFKEEGKYHESTTNIFEIMNVFDFSMQVYEFAGESAMLKKLSTQFKLANMYSDQGGLSRKFELYETLVSESYPLIKKRDSEDKMHYYFTRSLNRLAQLTWYWKGVDESIPLWTRLADYAQESSDKEREAILKAVEYKHPFHKSNR